MSSSSSSSSKLEAYVEPGACYLNDAFVRCGLTAEYCQIDNHKHGLEWVTHGRTEEIHFRSARELNLTMGDDNPCATDTDSDTDTTTTTTNNNNNSPRLPHTIPVGRCTSDSDRSMCTGDSSNCQNPYMFEDLADGDCSVAFNEALGSPTGLALYGMCKRRLDGHSDCFWSISDCQNIGTTHDYFPAVATTILLYGRGDDEACTCEETLVGACYYEPDDDYTCAVSEDACDDESVFVTVAELANRTTAPCCKLCPPFDIINHIPAPPSAPTNPPTTKTTTTTTGEAMITEMPSMVEGAPATPTVSTDGTLPEDATVVVESAGRDQTTVIVVGAVVSAVVGILILGAVIWVTKRRNEGRSGIDQKYPAKFVEGEEGTGDPADAEIL